MPGFVTAGRAALTPADLSPEPILAVVDGYRGSIVDLDRSLVVGPSSFARQRQSLAAELGGAGLQSGDRVVMAVSNGPLFPVALAAILAKGGTPLLVHAETPLAELKRLATQVGAPWIVSDGLDESQAAAARISIKTLGEEPWAHLQWAQLADRSAAWQTAQLPLLGVPLHYTSGTTGQPQIAVRPGHAALEEARHYAQTLGVDGHDVVLVSAPMSHAYAYGMGVMVPLLVGASVLTMRRFEPRVAQKAIAEGAATLFPAVPAMLDMLLAISEGRLPNQLRCVLSAGSPLTERTAREFRRRSGVAVRPLYGSTETGGIAIATAEEAIDADCVGRPMDGVGVRAQPPAYDSHWDPRLGKIQVRSSSMMAGYLTGGELDPSAITDGWFATGDLGWLDARGAVYLKGRQGDVINVCGMKVVPSEIEQIIAAMPGVEEVKVYAGRRPNAMQFVKAAVVATGLDVAQIRAHCQEHLVYYKRPEIVVLLSALPKSPAGKILRDQLP